MNEEQFVSFLNSRKKDTNFRKISLVQLFVYPEVNYCFRHFLQNLKVFRQKFHQSAFHLR